jgi:hypothetical protein
LKKVLQLAAASEIKPKATAEGRIQFKEDEHEKIFGAG